MLWTDFDRFGSFLDPWRTLERINRAAPGPHPAPEYPAVNIWTDGEGAIATAELPGIDPKTVDISIMGNSVTIRASRTTEEPMEGQSYHRRERWYGQFSRTVDMPYTINAEKVEAMFNRGVLQLTLPRAEEEKPKKITIKAE